MLVISITLIAWLSLFFPSVPAYSAVFNISSGDVAGLISAINAANSNGEENTIYLEPGTYTITAVDNTNNGPNGLPPITSRLAITGADAESTIIERTLGTPEFRFFHIAPTGILTLNFLTLQGGVVGSNQNGGAVANRGTLTLHSTILLGNYAGSGGGALYNLSETMIENSRLVGNSSGHPGPGPGGAIFNTERLSVVRSTFINNHSIVSHGGAIYNEGGAVLVASTTLSHNTAGSPNFGTGGALANFSGGRVTVVDSNIFSNFSEDAGGGLRNDGTASTLEVFNSTIVANGVPVFTSGGGISNSGQLTLTNTTVADNHAPNVGGGLQNSGTVNLANAILARNNASIGSDCWGRPTSLGNNFIGDPTDCDISFQPADLTGDPRLGNFIDDGSPGGGRLPLLPGSQAIDAGNDSACPTTDQLGTPRNGRCDIGAIEFYPVVNNLVALANITTAFDPTSVPGGPAGTFHITAEFMNTSNQAIVHPFLEVAELTGGNLLLNADGGAGGVGARLTLLNSATTPLEPGASTTFEFLIGLQRQEPFTFFVNMLGEPRTSNPSVSMR